MLAALCGIGGGMIMGGCPGTHATSRFTMISVFVSNAISHAVAISALKYCYDRVTMFLRNLEPQI